MSPVAERLSDGQIHDGRWQDLGAYTVYRGGRPADLRHIKPLPEAGQ